MIIMVEAFFLKGIMNSGGIEGSDEKIRKEIRKNINNITEDFLKEKDFLKRNFL